ncbi:MAG: fructose-6-phosphate aldolase [Holosporaceae bacterium]|jgi:transaldolase|nr:fructose-6-phosphate aldolase [Holosporaceae bacterium]
MEIFLDTANLYDISHYRDFICGVTTNPTIMAAYAADDHKNIIGQICDMVIGHVSVEVISENFNDMVREGQEMAAWNNKICIKLPCTFDGLKACRHLSANGIATNMTLCFSSAQALLAARCGAAYVSPFIGRLDDDGCDGLSLLEEISDIYDIGGYETKLLAASVRNVNHFIQSAMLGADAITIPPSILKQCFEHHLTEKGIKIFSEDFRKSIKG